MIYRIVLGASAKQYREAAGIEGSIRPHLSAEQIAAVECLQRVDIGLLAAGLEFEQRKAALMAYLMRLAACILLANISISHTWKNLSKLNIGC